MGSMSFPAYNTLNSCFSTNRVNRRVISAASASSVPSPTPPSTPAATAASCKPPSRPPISACFTKTNWRLSVPSQLEVRASSSAARSTPSATQQKQAGVVCVNAISHAGMALSVHARHGFHGLCIAHHGASLDSLGSDANGKLCGTGSEKEVDKSVSEANQRYLRHD